MATKNQTKTHVDQTVLDGGGGAKPVGGGDYNLREISIHSPSSPGEVLYLDHPSIFFQMY